MRTVSSLKGLVIFFHFTQGFRPGLTAIPPLRGSILRDPFHRANSKRVLTHALKARSTQATATLELP